MKKILFALSLVMLLFAPSIFAGTVSDIPAGTSEEYFNRGNSFEKQGNIDQAIADYTSAIRVYSKYAKAYYNRGKLYGKQGKISESIADYEKAVEINPKYTEAYYNLGNAYEKQANHSQAITSYTKAIGINPKYAAAYCNRGNAYQAQGNLPKAIADYDKAIEITPGFAGAYSNRANAYQEKGDILQAIKDYNKAIELKPEFSGFYANRGNIYQSQGKLTEAIADYDRAIEKNPDDSSSLYNRGLAYYGLEQYEKSVTDYKAAVGQNPSKDAYADFIKYFPARKGTDTKNVRNEIILAFGEKTGTETPEPVAVTSAAPAAPLPVAQPVSDVAVSVSGAPATVAAAAPVTITNLDQAETKQEEAKSTSKDAVLNVVNKWRESWQSGDMTTYRGCYDEAGFQSKGMKLDAWITYKEGVRKKSKDITINISDVKITMKGNTAKAVFTQEYSSSILKDKGKKTLELKNVKGEWKISKEIM
jgi:tetratricopeptide (TPR) repeat protein